MLALVAARQRTQAAEAAVQCRAQRHREVPLCAARALRLLCSPLPLTLLCLELLLHQRRQVQCGADGAWGVEVEEGGGRVGKSRRRGTGSL